MGFVYQFHHLLPEFSAVENVAMPLLIRGDKPAKAYQQAGELLAAVGLGERLKHRPGELSGGERQRAAIARALVNRPDCLLADEPTGNLDQDNAAHAFALMKKLIGEQHGAMIIVTHDMNLARQMDRCLYLVSGKLSDTPPPPATPKSPLAGIFTTRLKHRRFREAIPIPENNLSVFARLTGFAMTTPLAKAASAPLDGLVFTPRGEVLSLAQG